jgi:RNA polymerase sigma-70 factor (ECF subfamily)
MAEADKHDVTHLLGELQGANHEHAVAQLMPLVYDELRRLAHKYFRHERAGHTLQPTALVHEAYLRLVDQTGVDWQGRTHFYAVCAKVMRRVLLDYARGRQRARRGGGLRKLDLDSDLLPMELDQTEVLALHEAIEELTRLDPRQAHIVELRFFGGLTMEEVAHVVGVGKRTAEDEWTHAKAWLRTRLASEAEP